MNTATPARVEAPLVLRLGRLVRFSHTIFSVPFAAAAAAVAAVDHPIGWRPAVLVLACVVAARTAAMGYNRIADREIDARNPRTRSRELAAGTVRPAAAWALTLGAGIAFLAAAFAISPLTGALALVALPLALGYSLAKRFTWLCHFWLGVVLALAPIGAWVAVAGGFAPFPLLLGAGVLCWIAGFDVVYALADLEFDRREGLHSFPARFGPKATLFASLVLHVLAPAFFLAAGLAAGRGAAYFAGVVLAAAALLAGQVATWRGSKGDAVFMANGWVSLLFGAAVVIDVLWKGAAL
ncbi:MAG TPA: 4-hydroxybenzoate octaprenyltransferase [Vulgatibacter sp.]|nr:4-hydroxybenzoate octaprenyltransferase [Vulgatibacter sp.]